MIFNIQDSTPAGPIHAHACMRSLHNLLQPREVVKGGVHHLYGHAVIRSQSCVGQNYDVWYPMREVLAEMARETRFPIWSAVL